MTGWRLRRFEFVTLWGLRVFFLYPMRLDCPRCGVTVDRVPWADGKHQLTTTYMWFQCLSWLRASSAPAGTGVRSVARWRGAAITWISPVFARIDEIHWQRGSQFLTLVYQIDPTRKRLLWKHRRAKTLGSSAGSDERTSATCGRISRRQKAGHALHILDRFHIAKHMSDAQGPPRRSPLAPAARTTPLLKGALGPPETQGESDTRAARPLARAPPTQPAGGPRQLLREWFATSGATGRSIVDVMRSRIEPMKKVARMLRRHRPLILSRARRDFRSCRASTTKRN